MNYYSHDNCHFYVAPERDFKDFAKDGGLKYRQNLLGTLTRRPLVRELIDKWKDKTGLQEVALLEAHGDRRKNAWVYFKDESPVSYAVQDFIDEHDGKIAVIFLPICNPYNATITAKRSIVVHPSKEISYKDIMGHTEHYRVYIPEIGYADDSRSVRRVIKQIQ